MTDSWDRWAPTTSGATATATSSRSVRACWPRTRRFQRAYFGVDSDAALASGLPAYRPNGGIYALAATSGLSYQFDPRFGMFGYARYERLVGDAAKSPIIRELGSRNQFSGGLGLSYTFNIKR